MSLIDHHIPAPHFSERHSLQVRAQPAVVLEQVRAFRLEDDRFHRLAMALRELPGRLAHRGHQTGEARRAFGIDTFTVLDNCAQEDEGGHEIVYGLAGRFWRSDFGLLPLQPGTRLCTRQEPGAAVLALNFRATATAKGTVLSTETRVFCTDRQARIRFTPYWYLIRPVSGLLRQRMLAIIRDASEAAAGA